MSSTVKKYTNPKSLTPEMINELIEKIEMSRGIGTGKFKVQEIKITDRFMGDTL